MIHQNCCLFVGDLSICVSEQILLELFQAFGRVEHVEIKKGRKAFKLLEYGFVEFYTVEEAQNAMNHLDGKLIFGRKLRLILLIFIPLNQFDVV